MLALTSAPTASHISNSSSPSDISCPRGTGHPEHARASCSDTSTLPNHSQDVVRSWRRPVTGLTHSTLRTGTKLAGRNRHAASRTAEAVLAFHVSGLKTSQGCFPCRPQVLQGFYPIMTSSSPQWQDGRALSTNKCACPGPVHPGVTSAAQRVRRVRATSTAIAELAAICWRRGGSKQLATSEGPATTALLGSGRDVGGRRGG